MRIFLSQSKLGPQHSALNNAHARVSWKSDLNGPFQHSFVQYTQLLKSVHIKRFRQSANCCESPMVWGSVSPPTEPPHHSIIPTTRSGCGVYLVIQANMACAS